MKSSARFMTVVLGVFAVAAAFLAPRRDEWLAVLQDEGKQERVIAQLEPLLSRDPDNLMLLSTLARSYGEMAEYGRAIGLMTRYVVLRDDDADAYARLADLYRASGDEPNQIAMLRRSLATKRNLVRVGILARLYQKAGQFGEEHNLLTQFQTELTVSSGLLFRLAELRDQSGDQAGAIRVLMRPTVTSGTTKNANQAEARLLLASLLARSGLASRAVELGMRWIGNWNEPWLADRLLLGVVTSAPGGDVQVLADAVVTAHPEIRLFLVNRLASAGARPVARYLLSGWFASNPVPTADDIAAFLSICRQQDLLEVAWETFGQVVGRQVSPAVVSRFVKAMAANFGIGGVAPFWHYIPLDVLTGDPLLAAQLAFHNGDLTLTRQLVAETDVASLPAVDQLLWGELLVASSTPAVSLPILIERATHGGLAPDVIARYLPQVPTHGR